MPRLRLTLAYDGTAFAGWQLQAKGKGRTVQGCLEAALAKLCDQPVRVFGAGRTDAGVHALAQVAHADVPEARMHIPWQKALNALLPKDIAVTEAALAPPGFHARFEATAKTYVYTLWTEKHYVLPWRRPYVWDVGRCFPLDVAAMDAAARELEGTHDFAAFQNAGSSVKTTTRHMRALTRLPAACPQETAWQFCAEGFLKQMVRNLMGALVAVGCGKISPTDIRPLLQTGQRSLAPATAPAQGLCLLAVEYGTDGGRKRHLLHEPEASQG